MMLRIQGRLGNCYFLAAIASCAEGDDDILLKDLLIEEGLEQAQSFAIYLYISLYIVQ